MRALRSCPARGTPIRPGQAAAAPRAVPARAQPASDLRQRDALLPLVLAAAILVGRLAHFVRLEEDHLRDALVGVDLRGQRRRVRELEGDEAFPLGLEGRYVHDDTAPGVRALAEADREHVARNAEVLDRT